MSFVREGQCGGVSFHPYVVYLYFESLPSSDHVDTMLRI